MYKRQGFEWELEKSPAGAHQWVAKDAPEDVPFAHDTTKKQRPKMLTTDLSLRFDPIYGPISKRFLENPQAFADAFARAWLQPVSYPPLDVHQRLVPGGPGSARTR